MKPTLLRDWMGSDIAGWYLSEKLDGWRLMWNGEQYITRQGNVLECPLSWYDDMPNCWLDGELFAGRGEFNTIQKRISNGFDGLRFHVFDLPNADWFKDRLFCLDDLVLPSHCSKVPQCRVASLDAMMLVADRIVADGGEGVVLRDPCEEYHEGRTWSVQRWVPQDPEINRKR